MILKSFILDNLVSLCMKIINSVVVVGLYYGFLTTFSIGPSYLFLLRARVMEEGTEKKVSATTGFITGQLMMFISIYYAPLHLALGRPHTITVIALPYLLFHFFCNNHKHFLNYASTNQNSMRNFSIQRIFLNNLIFQLLNLFILPSSMLVRLVNIYMFRCNNQFFFLTSSFVGWLIGHILFMKWVGLVLAWIQQNNSIKSNVLIRSNNNKYIMSELRNRIFIIFLFITCIYYLGRTPAPIFINKLSEIQEQEGVQIDNKNKLSVERTSKTKVTKQEEKKSTEKYLSPSLFSEKGEDLHKIDERKEKDIFQLEKPLLNILFDYKRFHGPLRYIKNDLFENAVRNEMAQFFFHTSQSDAKERISFTYPSSLSTFLEMMQRKTSLFITEKLSYDELDNYYNHWSSINEQKRKKLSNKFRNRTEALDKEFLAMDVLENRIRLCNDETKKKYLPKIYDPLLNGAYRGQIKKKISESIKKKNDTKNYIWINKIHGILLNINTNYPDFEQKTDPFNKKSLSTEKFFFYLMSKFSGKSDSSFNFKGLSLFPEHEKKDSEDKKKKMKFLFDAILIDPNDKTIRNRKKCIGIKESTKKVPRWSYKLIDEVEYLEKDGDTEDYEIRSRKAKRVVIFTDDSETDNTYTDTKNTENSDEEKNTENSDEENEVVLIDYSQQPDFRRDIIKGSRRAQRRKTVTWKLFQASAQSPLFLDKIDKPFFFSFDIFETMQIFFLFQNWMWKNIELKISDYTEERKQNEEKNRIEIAEAWDSIIYAQIVRGFLLVTQSFIRKYILLPSVIIIKNIVRILLFQFPEWSEDLKDWNREMYIKCTYNGVPLSETEFPKNWLTEGIQIKILFPFRLKPWHRSKLRSPQKEKDPMKKKQKAKKMDFCFLTIFGMEVELPFSSSPRNRFSFFDPIFNELKKKMKNCKKSLFLVLKVLNERTQFFLNISKETAQWIIKSIFKKIVFLKEKIKKLLPSNLLFLFRLRKIYELNKIKKNLTISNSNPMIYDSTIPIQSINWTNYSLTEKKIKDLNDRTKTIIKQIEKLTKNKKRGFLISERNICSKKITYGDKRLELQKNIWQILQRRNVRLARKSHFFFQFFMERVYINIFVCIINIPRINVQLFLLSTKKKINKYIYNNKERVDKKNQSIINFISTMKKSIWNISNMNSQNFCDVSSLSQAYVFYKLSQTQVINLDKSKLRSVFEYHGRRLFLKNQIKDSFFRVQGISHSKLKHKNPPNSVMNQWTNWLKGHYQYDLSQSGWSRLVPQKWRNRMNERHVAQNKDLTKCHSYAKKRLILYKKYETNPKKKMKKQYEYDLLSYKSINYADKKDSYIYGYRSPFQANNNQVISYNSNTRKNKLCDMMDDIPIKNYIIEDYILDMEKNMDRKYFDWRILNFCLRNQVDFGAWIDTDYYFTLHQEINPSNPFFDWMGMNVEILNRSIANRNFFFFSKFFIFYNAYTSNPWIIPIKLLFFNFNVNQNVSEKKNITEKKKIDIFRPSKKKKSLELELETRNQGKTEYAGSKKEKDVEEDYAGSDMKRGVKKKKYKNKIEEKLNCFLRRYLLFQWNWRNCLNKESKIMKTIKVYCLLLRLINIKEIAIAFIQKRELNLAIMKIQNQNQKDLTLTELIKNELFNIEPIRLSRKNHEQFIMYQTINLSLIHKRKHQINKKYREKGYIDKKNFAKSITRTRDQKLTEKKEKNHYDLLVPENILSARRRRQLRIQICFNPKNRNSVHRNTAVYNENKVNNCCQVLATSKDLDRDKKKLINLKLFLWPNYRLEDLACMNRYWFDTNNGSRFSMVRIHMYPRLKIR